MIPKSLYFIFIMHLCVIDAQIMQEENKRLTHPNIHLLPQLRCGLKLEDRRPRGNISQTFDNPWLALIEIEGSKNNISCAGSIINKRYILTAAHCLHEAVGVSVILGEHDKSTNIDCDFEGTEKDCAEPAKRFNVEKIISHSDFNFNQLINDIALIRLTEDIFFSPDNIDGLQAICLPINVEQIHEEFSVGVTGWEQSVNKSVVLQTYLNVIPNEECRKLYPESINVTSNHICVNKRGSLPVCIGDSGGPALNIARQNDMVRLFQFGIISAGYESCNILPGLYTKVEPYIDWILNTIHE